MAGHGEKFDQKKEQAVVALLVQPTISEAAKQVGIGERTLLRWMKRDDFQAIYRAARREVMSQAIAHLQQATVEAVATLRSVMKNESAPASAKVTAARIILDLALKVAEVEDLGQRLTTLEQRFEEIQQNSSVLSGEVAR